MPIVYSQLTNREIKDRISSMFGIEGRDVVGYVVVCLSADKNIEMISNGNQAQATGLVQNALDRLNNRGWDGDGTGATIPDE
jgi:hypothetical protein